MLQSYRPSNRVPPRGIFFLLLAIVCGGFICGLIAFTVAQLFWLILLFPIGLGLMVGGILSKLIATQNIRSPLASAVSALLMGLVLYATFHLLAYQSFRWEVAQIFVEREGPMDSALQEEMIDLVLTEETGFSGFFGYLKLQAQEGISIGRVGSTNPITLNEPLTWLYWLLEAGLIVGFATGTAVSSAKKPFCELCQSWYRSSEHLGSVAMSNAAQFMELVRAGNMQPAGALLVGSGTPTPSLEVYIQRCLHDSEHNSVLAVREMSLNRKGQTQFKEVLQGMIAPHEAAALKPADATS
ncbi:MAG TPA: hypothetical protein VFZ66_16385 [Herpetosiphonaceae bacterium]